MTLIPSCCYIISVGFHQSLNGQQGDKNDQQRKNAFNEHNRKKGEFNACTNRKTQTRGDVLRDLWYSTKSRSKPRIFLVATVEMAHRLVPQMESLPESSCRGRRGGRSGIGERLNAALAIQAIHSFRLHLKNSSKMKEKGDIYGKPTSSFNTPTQTSIPADGGYCCGFRPLQSDEDLRLRENRRKVPLLEAI
jgi:hypothetical protein